MRNKNLKSTRQKILLIREYRRRKNQNFAFARETLTKINNVKNNIESHS